MNLFGLPPQSGFQELVGRNAQKVARDEVDLVLLPKQLWCSVSERNDGSTCCEVGWLLGCSKAITSRCIFSKEAELMVSLPICRLLSLP